MNIKELIQELEAKTGVLPQDPAALVGWLSSGLYAKGRPEKVKALTNAIAKNADLGSLSKESLKTFYMCQRAEIDGCFSSFGGKALDPVAFCEMVERLAEKTIFGEKEEKQSGTSNE